MSLGAVATDTPGSTTGQFGVAADGSGTYTIPITAPPGTAGLQPELSLTYSSRGGPGSVGYGWTIGGISVIQRGPRNLTDDGEVRGAVLDAADALYLDGQKLVPVSSQPAGTREFRGRVDNFSRIRGFGWTATGADRFVVETKAGTRMFYGSTPASRVTVTEGATVVWLCDRIEDNVGNFIMFTYASDGLDYRLVEASYTGNAAAGLQPYAKISFEYDTIAPYELRYLFGNRIEPKYQLRTIQSTFRGTVLRRYDLVHASVDSYRKSNYLVSLTESGRDGLTYRPLRFSYSSSQSKWESQNRLKLPITFSQFAGASSGFRFLDLDGDGRPDLIFRSTIAGAMSDGAYVNDKSAGWVERTQWAPPVDLATDSGPNPAVVLHDVSGHSAGGRDILYSTDAAPGRVFTLTSAGWTAVAAPPPFQFVRAGVMDKRYLFLDVDPDAKNGDELLWNSPAQGKGAARFSAGGWAMLAELVPPLPFPTDTDGNLNGVYAVDVDCDGRKELVYHARSSGGTLISAVYKIQNGKWSEVTDTAFRLPFDPVPNSAAIRFADIDGDGCEDAVVAYEANGKLVRQAYLASAQGWNEDSRPLPDFVLWRQGGSQAVAEIADVDGDHRADIIWNTSQPSVSVGAFLSRDDTWESDVSYTPPTELPSSLSDRATKFQVIDLYANGHPRLVYSRSGSPPLVFMRTAGQWTKDVSFNVPVRIAQFDKQDTGVRFLDLNGDGRIDLTFSRQALDLSTQKGSFIFDPATDPNNPWRDDVRFHLPVPTYSEDQTDLGTALVDINGDGLTDLLVGYNQGSGVIPAKFTAYINCSQKPECASQSGESSFWQKTDTMKPPEAFAEFGTGPLGARFVDLNGDGLTDIVIARTDAAAVTHLAQLASVARSGTVGTVKTIAAHGFTDGQFVVLRGQDSSPDWKAWEGVYAIRIVSADTFTITVDEKTPATASWATPPLAFDYAMHSSAYLNTGSGWTKSTAFAPPVEFVRPSATDLGDPQSAFSKVADTNVQIVDLNGDRLPDLLCYFTTEEPVLGRVIRKGAFLNTGSGWVPARSYEPPLPFVDADHKSRQMYLLDVNGDGLPDLIYADKGKSATYLNTGVGWQTTPELDYAVPDGAILAPAGLPINTQTDQGFRFLDLNGDGLVDIGFRWVDGSSEVAGAYLNTGHGWKLASGSDFVLPIPVTETGRGDLGVRPIDLNADGIVDLAQSYLRDGNDERNEVFLNESGTPDLLLSVQNGLGAKLDVTYESALGLDPTTLIPTDTYKPLDVRTSMYPIVDAPMPGYVVTKTQSAAPGVPPRITSYRYGDYRVDIRSGRSLGFGFQETRDEAANRVTQVQFAQFDGLVGSIASTDVIHSGANSSTLVSSRMDWRVATTVGETTASGFRPTIYQPYLANSQTQSWDLHSKPLSSEKNSYQYDAYFNPTLIRTDLGDGSATETTNTYQTDTNRWLLGRLIEARVTLSAPGSPDQVRTARFAYAQNGQLIQEVSLAGTPLQVTKTYQLDAFGNRLTATTTTLDGNSPNRTATTFDALGRFGITQTNALRQVSRTVYDDVSGVVIERRHPNGVAVQTAFDSLQRAVSQTSGYGVTTTSSTSFPGSNASKDIAFVITTQTSGLPASETFYDGAGRPRIQRSVGAAGRPVVAQSDYDARGRLSRASLPYFENEQPYYIERVYDDLDRVVRENRPDGQVLTTVFDGLKTRVSEAQGRTTESMTDMHGRSLYTIDQAGGKTSFTYDAAGKLTSVVNAIGQATTVSYNLAGQRIEFTDPALGRWHYKFDSYGNLIWQQDSRGRIVTFEYDALGRVLSRRADGTVTAKWTYDTALNGIGQPDRIESSGFLKTFSYDQFGRVIVAKLSVGKDEILVEQSYDALGRPSLRHYSTGLSVQNSYDSYGFPAAINIAERTRSTLVWQAISYDAARRLRSESFGNGVKLAHQFEQQTGRLLRSRAETTDHTPVRDLRLEYDLAGNITRKTDDANGQNERYEYDALNRLVKASGTVENTTLDYDAIGNILNKSNTGTYQYCGLEHRLCQIAAPTGTVTAISYDAAGNMTQYGDRKVVVDAEGRISRISSSWLNHVDFSYGADGELFREEMRHGTTHVMSLNLGDTQILDEEFSPPLFPTPERTRVRHFIQSPGGTLGYYEFTYWRYPGEFAKPIYDERAFSIPQRTKRLTTGMTYFLQDQIGSVQLTLDDEAGVVERLNYDAFGARVESRGYRYHAMTTGFSGHEHLDGFDLIHMGGRVYSPFLGRFLSADPVGSGSGFSQAYNHYSYSYNNPLRLIDPTGYGIWGDIWDGIKGVGGAILGAVAAPFIWVGQQIGNAARWVVENWRTIVVIAASVALSVIAPGLSPVLIGAFAGGLNAGLSGGSFDDIMAGAILGAVGGAFSLAGSEAVHGAMLFGMHVEGAALVASSGLVGGFMSAAHGGDFWVGFCASAAAQILSPIATLHPGTAFRVAAAAMIGGIVSRIAGKTFEDGAMTGAFAELFRITSEPPKEPLPQRLVDEAKRALFALHQNDADFDEDSLNFMDSVKITEGRFMALQADGRPMTPDGTIYWNGSIEDLKSSDPSDEQFGTFIHEVEHLYQYYVEGQNVTLKGAWLHMFGTDIYDIGPYQTFSGMNIEQQAEYLRLSYTRPNWVQVVIPRCDMAPANWRQAFCQ